MEEVLYQTYKIALPIILTAFMGYIIWLLKLKKGTEMPIAGARCYYSEYKSSNIMTNMFEKGNTILRLRKF